MDPQSTTRKRCCLSAAARHTSSWGQTTDTKAVKSPLELELWCVRRHGRTLSCELRCDANGWDVLIRENGEPLFPRRCTSENEARYVANGIKQDELKTGAIENAD